MISPPTRSPSRLVASSRRPGQRSQQALGDLGGGRDHVLAVVEHDQHVAVADHLSQPVRVGQIEGGGDRRGDTGRVANGSQLHQAPTQAQIFSRGAPDLEGEPGLAHPSRPDEGDEPLLGHQGGEVAPLGVAPDQRSQRLGDARPGPRHRNRGDERRWRRGQRGVLGEDRRLQPAEIGPGFEAQLLAQEAAALLEDPEGVGLPAGSVQSQHQQPAEPLAQGMGGDEVLELDDDSLVAAELELDSKALLQHGQP